MNAGIFLIMLAIVLFLLYYKFMFSGFKARFAKYFFWIAGVASVIYAMIFNGLFDRLFIILFSVVLIFSKMFLKIADS